MSETTRRKAADSGPRVDAGAAREVPAPRVPRPDPETSDPATAEAISRRMEELDLRDTGSILHFGSAAQAELQKISQSMLADVRNKDIGPAGDSLRDMVSTIRGFSASELDMRGRRRLWERLIGRAAPIARFAARFEDVQRQIDDITERLLAHEQQLLKDIAALDQLYDKTLAFYDELGLYIAAGEAKLARIDGEDIPAAERSVAAAGDAEGVMEAQELRDLRGARDDLERRVHDLKLTRQVTMQSLPSIRLVQENDKSLVAKINSTLVNTVPLWETQLAQAVTIRRSEDAADAVKSANDLTNELLTSNAKNLREANAKVRREVERGVFDIEAVRTANSELIATIEESLKVADEGKTARAAAEDDLMRMESELKGTLARASAAARVGRNG